MQIRNKQPLTVLALLLASLPLSLLAQPADHAGRAAGDALLAATPERVPFQLAAKSDDLPLSRDSLFGTDEPAAKPAAKPVAAPAAAPASEPPLSRDALFGTDTPAVAAPADELPLSRDALFGDGDDALPKGKAAQAVAQSASRPVRYRGFIQNVMAYTTPGPAHWSEAMTRADVSAQGDFGSGVKWHLGARVDFDAVYPMSDFYPQAVNDNQTLNAMLRENYIDIGAGDWDFRVGRQHIIWGEMVGLLFGDVVSAKDMRHFVLPEFDILRIPQWAARAEYFKGDFHAEAIWIPVASYDNIGKPGAEFYPNQPVPAGYNVRYLNEKSPDRDANNMNYGLRLSTLKNGWDISGFHYQSTDINPTFYRQFEAPNTLVYQAQHDRINQTGATVSKDFGTVVFKAEGVYTRGRNFTTLSTTDSNGVVRQNTLDWAAGLDFTLPAETRLNVQVFQRQFFNHDANIISDRHENGYSLLLNNKFFSNWEAQAIFISSLNRSDWLLRPRLSWNLERNWRWILGADIFRGPQTGLFGRYDAMDRVYSEIRYSF